MIVFYFKKLKTIMRQIIYTCTCTYIY